MRTRYNKSKKRTTRKNTSRKSKKTGSRWVTAIDAAQKEFKKTGSLTAARKTLRKQALTNARKLFGSVSSM